MEFDNVRDRFEHGFDAGQIVDGEVVKDPKTGHFIIKDEDGVGFDPQAALATLEGQSVRITMISHRSMQKAQELYEGASGNQPS